MDENVAAFWPSKKYHYAVVLGEDAVQRSTKLCALAVQMLELMRVGPLGVSQHMQGKLNNPKTPKLQRKKTHHNSLDTQRHLTAGYINHRRTGRERETT